MKRSICFLCAIMLTLIGCSDSDMIDVQDFSQNDSALSIQMPTISYDAGADMEDVTAVRVAKKVNFLGKKEITKGFEAFDVKNADYSVLYKTRIAEIADPDVHKTVMFMTAGQKSPIGPHPNGVTGQGGYWDDDCDDAVCPNIRLDGRSLAMKLYALNWFDAASTWFAVSPDNNFDYTLTLAKRNRLVEGFTAWIKTKITTDTENIVLAGSSRGGCLSMRIAQELRKLPEYNDIQIYVMSFDGVCNKGEELGTSMTKIDNPVRDSGTFYGGWAVDMNAQYPNHDNLHIYQISGGQEVVPATGIRAFSAYEGAKPPKVGTDIDWEWYKQKWVHWAHKEIGNPYSEPDTAAERRQAVMDTTDSQLRWLDDLLH